MKSKHSVFSSLTIGNISLFEALLIFKKYSKQANYVVVFCYHILFCLELAFCLQLDHRLCC